MKFYLPGVDAELDFKEFLQAVILVVIVIGTPILIKFLLSLI